jgi:hypothetical protein
MNTNWYDLVLKEEETETTRILRMNAAEWVQAGQRILRGWIGDLRDCMNYLFRMDTLRVRAPSSASESEFIATTPLTPRQLDFAVWKDMVEEPGKYGDDIVEWLDINDRLMAGPSAWRLAAFWTLLEDQRMEDKVIPAVVKIQAMVRGYQARVRATFRDCCMCLAHCVSPLKTDVGMMCRECARQGPYIDMTGPLADPWDWYRGDFHDEEIPACKWCLAPLEDGQDDFCDADCLREFKDDVYRDD